MLILQKDAGVLRTGGRGCQLRRPTVSCKLPLEALQNYTEGLAVLSRGRFLAAVPWLERAIDLDPSFAMAYHVLSLAYNNAGDTGREAEYKRKAFAWIASTRPGRSRSECACRVSTARGSTSASSNWPTSKAIRLPSPGKFNGSQASRRSTSASACRRPI